MEGDVRRDKHAFVIHQDVIGDDSLELVNLVLVQDQLGLVFEHALTLKYVESHVGHYPRLKRPDKCDSIHKFAASCVDDCHSPFHLPELHSTEHMMILFRVLTMECDDVSLGEQIVER